MPITATHKSVHVGPLLMLFAIGNRNTVMDALAPLGSLGHGVAGGEGERLP